MRDIMTRQWLRRAWIRAVALVVSVPLLLIAAGCGGSSQDSGSGCTLTLGATGPLTGPSAAWGIAEKQAAKMAAWEVNQDGGLKIGDQTCHVTVESYNDKYTSNGAASAMNKFASDGIKFVIGPMGSPEVTGAKPVAARHGMLLMSDSFARDAIGPKWPLVFHNGPGPGVWAKPIIAEAKKEFSIKSAVTVAPDDQGGKDIAEVDAKAYSELGIDVQKKVYYARGTSDFAPIVTRALSSDPGVVDLASSPPGDAGVLVKQLRQAGFDGPIAHLGGPGTAQIAKVAGGYDVLGDFYDYQPYNPTDAKVKKFEKQVKKALGHEAEPNTTLWTPGARLVLKAISKAGTMDDTKAVAKALRKMPLNDPVLGNGVWTGKEEFGINQEVSYPFYIELFQKGKSKPSYTKLTAESG